jgi:hypothetical protein
MISTKKLFGLSIAARSTRRTLVVAYWCFVAVFSCAFLPRGNFNWFGVLLAVQLLIQIPIWLGGVRAGGMVKPFRGIHWVPLQEREHVQSVSLLSGSPARGEDASLDERETSLRDRVHFVAYTVSRWFALLLFGLYCLLAVFHPAWLGQAGPFFLFLLTVTLWSLPQSLILWTEPDMEEPQ